MEMRGFQVAKGFETQDINLPKRMTTNAAGYDFEAAEEVVIKPIWGTVFRAFGAFFSFEANDYEKKDWNTVMKPTLVKTGTKSYMAEDEALFLYNRSSNPLKLFLWLSNSVGVIDSDYYENEDNDGHIMFQFVNFGLWPVHVKKGDRIGQGIFQKFLLADGDVPGSKRKGGHGHTNEQG
jgi:dUTP pyrophosphatase